MTQAILDRLGRKLEEQRPTYQQLEPYFTGKQHGQFFRPELRIVPPHPGAPRPAIQLNWPRLVVSALEERLDVDGFRLSRDEPADRDLWRIWQANRLDEASQQAHLDALVLGCAYVVVWASRDPKTPRITVESPRQMRVERDPMTGDVTAALKRWTETGSAHAVVYRPDVITRWTSTTPIVDGSATVDLPAESFTAVESIDNPLGQVPVVALVNRPRLLTPDGESEMTDIIQLTDAVSKIVTDMMISSEYAAAPRRWITGYNLGETAEEANQTVRDLQQNYGDGHASRIWLGADKDTKFGQFPEASLDGFVAAIDTLTQQASAISGLPPLYFGIHGSEVASADAIRSSEATLVSKARRRQRAFGGAWEDVMRLAALVRDGVQRPGMESLETIWRDPETRTVAQAADAAVKKLAVGVSREQVLEDLGYSPVQIQRMAPAAPAVIVPPALTVA